MPKYGRPSYFPKKEWEDLTNITANPNGKRAIEKAAEFQSIKDIQKHLIDLEQKNNINIPINNLNTELILGQRVDVDENIRLSFLKFINPLNFLDVARGFQTIGLIKGYQGILTENYNKLQEKKQQTFKKEPMIGIPNLKPLTNSNINKAPEAKPISKSIGAKEALQQKEIQ